MANIDSLSDVIQTQLQQIVTKIDELTRGKLESAFSEAELWAEAQKIADTGFRQYVDKNTAYSSRHALDYIAMRDRFEGMREELIRLAAQPSVLTKLATKSDAVVEEFLVALRSGKPVTHEMVNAIINEHRSSNGSSKKAAKSGRAGLEEAMQAARRTQAEALQNLACATLELLRSAYVVSIDGTSALRNDFKGLAEEIRPVANALCTELLTRFSTPVFEENNAAKVRRVLIDQPEIQALTFVAHRLSAAKNWTDSVQELFQQPLALMAVGWSVDEKMTIPEDKIATILEMAHSDQTFAKHFRVVDVPEASDQKPDVEEQSSETPVDGENPPRESLPDAPTRRTPTTTESLNRRITPVCTWLSESESSLTSSSRTLPMTMLWPRRSLDHRSRMIRHVGSATLR